jgi:hypothetical protein
MERDPRSYSLGLSNLFNSELTGVSNDESEMTTCGL